jgi:hypothetical protein
MLNPRHPAFTTISIGPPTTFPIDPRIADLIRSA